MLLATISLISLLAAPAPGPDASQGPPSTESEPHRHHRHGVAELGGPALSFDDAVGASAETPGVRGLDDAAAQKRELDDAISSVPIGPQVQLMVGAQVHPSGSEGLELQATVTQSWSLAGYGRKRIEAARAQTEVIEVEARAAALDQRLAAARGWIVLHAAEQQLVLAESELTALEQRAEALERARQAGVGTRADVADARAQTAAAELRVGNLRGDVHDLGLALAREVGGDTHKPHATAGDYPSPQLPSEEVLRAAFDEVESLPQIVRQRLLARAERARAVEIEAQRGTRLNAGLSVQREAESDLVVFGVLGGTISTSKGERARGVAVAAARRAEAEAETEALALEATLTTAIHDLHHSQSQIEILEQHTLPAHLELVASRTQALELGEGTRPLLLDAEARLRAVERALAAAQAEWVWARVQVWLYYQACLAEGGA